jgi:hypothetical protein
MNGQALGLADLKATIEDIQTRYSRLSQDDLFVLWFYRAYVTDNEDRAAEAVAGGSHDKGIDGLLIDDAAKAVFVVQAKYRRTLGDKLEKLSDVASFAEKALCICEPDHRTFADYLSTMEPGSAERFKEARKRVVNQHYGVGLYYVTLGKCSPSVRADADQIARQAACNARFEVIDGRRVMLILRDYLDGVAPPILTLDLEMEKGPNVTVNSIAQRYDDYANIESWVFPMRGDCVAALYETAGIRIFARNIRGYLGLGTKKKDVNRSMVVTLTTEPERFFYYNNGITMICDDAVKRSRQGRDILQVSNPQIINGQQTTRVLAAHSTEARRASVLVKVIRVPREVAHNGDGFEALVSQIVAGTNWQNPITASDLMSNDRIQVDLERSFRKLGYVYIRKRQSKGEARRSAPGKHYRVLKKEEIAQAVAACDLDPAVVRAGRENLFEEDMYRKVFPNSDTNYFLPRYRLLREVTYCSRGDRDRRYAQWVVLNFVWSRLAPIVRASKNARAFRIQCEGAPGVMAISLSNAIDRVFNQVLRFYRRNRGRGNTAIDSSVFFKQRGHHKGFEQFWRRGAKSKKAFNSLMAKVQESIEQFDE